ncbi:alkaline phosphatase D family protein [Aquabacterium sp. OR-4]|uniref:alkaline phosphatase D family protein n=1 Tax=Aquabacterium sp. OR-4 TaxID=2978127 RepID=UPI0021B17C4D|nr:alkaline phosphatase D family protein [Aquabacterium sp. OR-4]MDT7837753.1 alkaline phosphatase D family protein [Aquabacterium sp. OR-4]
MSPLSLHRRALLAAGTTLGLSAPLFVRHALAVTAADVPRFALGVASGQPRASSLVLWTRLTGLDLPPQAPVQWELAHDEAFTQIAARGTELAEAAWAHSVHAEPAGLAPGRWYFYRFTALGQRSPVGRTRTAPAADAPLQGSRLRAVLASCQRWEHGHYAAWAHVAQRGLDLVLFAGDYIYEYAAPPSSVRPHDLPAARTLAHYRERHALHKSDEALQAAHAAMPWWLIWDDHEVINDYAGLHGPQLGHADLTRQRAAAYQAYWEHQPLRKAQRPVNGALPLFERASWGRLATLHLLDTRQHRDPQACQPLLGGPRSPTVKVADCAALADPARSPLGAAQERWLADGWDHERPWNLLVQTTLMARASRTAVTPSDAGTAWVDGWDGYPLARQRLLQGVAERRLAGTVVLGGDVHAHYAADLKPDFRDERAPAVATEFCCTSISSHGVPQLLVDRLLAHNPHLRHGRSDQRGCTVLTLDAHQLQAEMLAVHDSSDARSPVAVQARFAVDARQPGVQQG